MAYIFTRDAFVIDVSEIFASAVFLAFGVVVFVCSLAILMNELRWRRVRSNNSGVCSATMGAMVGAVVIAMAVAALANT